MGTPKDSPEIRTYRHATLPGALAALKEDLGDDAYILHTRHVEPKGLLGFKGQSMVEIQATLRRPEEGEAAPRQTLLNRAYGPTDARRRMSPGRAVADVPAEPRRSRRDGGVELEKLEQDVNQMKTMLKEMVLRSREHDELAGLDEELQSLHTHLIDQGVKPTRAKGLMKSLNQDLSGEDLANPRKLREHLRNRIVEALPVAPGVGDRTETRPRVAAFIGPTGVGKTTTVSKLAGHFHHYEQRDVGLLTIDTYRIAAADQLHRVAEIVDCPIRVETSPVGLERSLENYNDRDLVLLDTAGRSPRDTLQMNELKRFLEAAEPDEVYLVLPATLDAHALEHIIARFGPLANRIVLTKLDEAYRLGPLLDILVTSELPVAYWTFGQSIPDDIATVNPRRLAGLLLGEEEL